MILAAWVSYGAEALIPFIFSAAGRHLLILQAIGSVITGAASFLAVRYLLDRAYPKKRASLSPAASIALMLLIAATGMIGSSLAENRYRGITSSFVPPKIKAGPYIQFGPYDGNRAVSCAHSMMIRWFSPAPDGTGRHLLLGTSPFAMKIVPEDPGGDGMRHTVSLTGLTASTRYWYRVPDACGELHHFTTGPADAGGPPFRFLCLGDSGNTRDGGDSFCYRKYVNDAAGRYYQKLGAPAFAVLLGDAVRTGNDIPAWKKFFSDQHDPSATVPSMMTLGNHECLEDNGAHSAYFFTHPSYYSFDYGGVHFLALHPFDGIVTRRDGPGVSTGGKQYRFAREDLLRNRGKKWIVVSIHIPLLSTGDYNHNEILMRQYRKLFDENGVDLVLSGHDHHFDSFAVPNKNGGRTLYIVNGSGGSALDAYIMDRKDKRWRGWRHHRESRYGLYQNDEMTAKHHIYGELSWGFLDVAVAGGVMTVRYLRWLDYPEFLSATGQDHAYWAMKPIAGRKGKHLLDVTLVKEFTLKKRFPY